MNVSNKTVHMELYFYFKDRDPVAIKEVEVKPQRSNHIRINNLKMPDNSKMLQGVPYSLVVKSDIPVTV